MRRDQKTRKVNFHPVRFQKEQGEKNSIWQREELLS
jgi:hypothetical protein